MYEIPRQIKEATQSLTMHKFRSFLSMLGIIFGVAAFISMLSVGEGAKRETIRQIELLGTCNIIIREADLSKSARAEAAEALSPGLTYEDAILLKKGCRFADSVAATRDVETDILLQRKVLDLSVAGTEPGFLQVNNLNIRWGRFLADLDLARQERVCVLGAETARKMFGFGWPALDRTVSINDQLYRIIGVLENRAVPGKKFAAISHRPINNQIYIPLTNAMMIESPLHKQGRNLSEITVHVDKAAAVPTYTKIVQGILKRSHRDITDYQFFPLTT